MKTIYIIIGYWLFAVALTYIVRSINQRKDRLKNAMLIYAGLMEKTSLKEHLKIIFLKAWLVPVGLILLLFKQKSK